MNKPIALIDGDVLVYRFAHAHQQNMYWREDQEEPHSVVDEALACADMKDFIEDILSKTKAIEYRMCLSDPDYNYRKDVMPTYKSNRKKTVKPLLYNVLREELLNKYDGDYWPELEADDMLGILATSGEIKTPIICTIDKDLKQVPGIHYNWNKDEFATVTRSEGNLLFYTQILTGDPVDGYTGIPGVGPKKAEKILEPYTTEEEYWYAVAEAYAMKGLDYEFAIQTARVAKILQAEDYDIDNYELSLWEPPELKVPN